MKYIYNLNIKCNGDPSLVTKVLGVDPSKEDDSLWVYEIIEREDDEHYDFINRFLDILNDKYFDLQKKIMKYGNNLIKVAKKKYGRDKEN